MNEITPALPEFPRPDLPVSHPENYPTLRLRVARRLGLPDDGRLYLSDAIDSGVLLAYGGHVISDNEDFLLIDFASLHGAVSWAEGITETGLDRTMISIVVPGPLAGLYGPATIRVALR